MITTVLKTLFGGAGAIKDVAEVFTPNAEKSAQRASDEQTALHQAYQAEFAARQNRTWFDAFADGVNRLIRPAIALAVLSSFVLLVVDPKQFKEIATALTAMPDGYWALLSVVIAFYFGGRMQLKSQDFQFKAAQAQVITDAIKEREEFRKLEMDDDEPDKLVGDSETKNPSVEAKQSGQPNKIARGFRKARDENKKLAGDLAAAKNKLRREEKRQVASIWPDEMFVDPG